MVALLMLAAGFALGLFFGWLLHRERVERALYEDVARHRDRAAAALAETSARLELANKDMIRLRSQLSDAQQLLDDRDATIADLRAWDAEEHHEGDADALDAEVADRGPVDAAADAATTPSNVTRLDDADHTDITEEVSLRVPESPGAGAAADVDLGDQNDQTVDVSPAPDVSPPAAVEAAGEDTQPRDEPIPSAVGPPVVDVLPEPDAERDGVESPVDGSGETDVPPAAQPSSDAIVDDVPADGEAVRDTTDDLDDDVSEATRAAGRHEPGIAEAPAIDEPVGEVGEAGPVIGEPRVVDEPVGGEVATARGPGVPDDLQRIAGIGPALEWQLHAEGITTYRQLALLDEESLDALQQRRPQLVRRMRRGGWAAQARRLHAEIHGDAI